MSMPDAPPMVAWRGWNSPHQPLTKTIMSTFTETIVETFHVVSCYSCSIRFGIPSQLYKRAVTDAKGYIHCPACGCEFCWRESDDQRRIKELERKLEWEANECARQRQSALDAKNELNATKSAMSRIKNRVGAGVCPCCNRSVSQLARHMASKHPEFNK